MNIGDGAVAEIDAADVPHTPEFHATTGDRVFRGLATGAASVSLFIVGATLWFLIDKSRPAFHTSGIWKFFTTTAWNTDTGHFGVLGMLEGTLVIAAIAMVIAVPLGVAMALFINEYAPGRLRTPLTTVIDLLAALPSLLFGMWGRFYLQRHLAPVATFLSHHLSALPFLKLTTANLIGSSFIAGCVVALMITPIITAVSRDVMAQVPREQCEGALALGGTRWGMIRDVILPFSRGGIVGGALLGFGRALGETIAVALLLAPVLNGLNTHILQGGGSSVAAYIAVHFGEANSIERSGLVGAGLALFLLAFAVNFLARLIVRRAAT